MDPTAELAAPVRSLEREDTAEDAHRCGELAGRAQGLARGALLARRSLLAAGGES